MVGIPRYLWTAQRRPELAGHLHGISGRKFARAAAKNFILLQLLFLGLFSYIFGALFQQGERTHNMTIGFVDYDGGAIGAAVRHAYGTLQSDTFPTLDERSPSDFPDPSSLESVVCSTGYWATLYIHPNASLALASALASPSPSPASTYNPNKTLTFIWNQARYPPIVDALIASNLALLSQTAQTTYTSNLTALPPTTASLPLLASPWTLSSINIRPTTQGSRAIYNTVAIILIMMQEFFYLGVINSLHQAFSVYTKLRPSRIILFRAANSLAYCLVGSLCVAGAIWAFRNGWDVGAREFGLSWMVLWLFAHVNFQTLDVFSVWLPMGYVPMALVAWVVLNVTSVIVPFELSAAWYRIGYAMPAHEAYQVLTGIWSGGGCGSSQLRYALPVLFAWEVVASVLAVMGVYRRVHFAGLAEEEVKKQFGERVEAAMEFQRRREGEIRREEREEVGVGMDKDGTDGETTKAEEAEEREAVDVDVERRGSTVQRCRDEERVRRELVEEIEKEDELILQETRRGSRARPNFGPTFGLPFGEDGDERDS